MGKARDPMSERTYVDFNTMNQDVGSGERRVWIHPNHIRATFRPGMRVVLFDEELEVEATLDVPHSIDGWWAHPDWATRRDLPYP